MKRDEILAMEAGRELDALVAEKVMGWERRTYWVGSSHPEYHQEERQGLFGPEGLKRVDRMHPYSTDIADAWEVASAWEYNWTINRDVGKCGEEYETVGDRLFRVILSAPGMPMAGVTAETGPLAISRAALLAVMEAD